MTLGELIEYGRAHGVDDLFDRESLCAISTLICLNSLATFEANPASRCRERAVFALRALDPIPAPQT